MKNKFWILFTSCLIGKLLLSFTICAIFLSISSFAHAIPLETGSDWRVNLDTTLQYMAGWRIDKRNDKIAGNPVNAQADYLFDRGDLITSRVQALFEFQGIYKQRHGYRFSGSIWKDFAFDDRDVAMNPDFPDSFNVYPDGRFSHHTSKYHIQGEEMLDAFVFTSFEAGDMPVSVRLGRSSVMWGNAFFFGFSNIAYSQQPIDYIKGFTQPGSEVKELFLPRTQVMATISPAQRIALSGQYFFEYQGMRFPEAGTHLAPADIAYEGPVTGGPVTDIFGNPIQAGKTYEPDHVNKNYGFRAAWSPEWANGDLAFYYRKLDEVQPWLFLELYEEGGGNIHLSYAEDVTLHGLSYETSIGLYSLGFEVSYLQDSGLQSAFFSGSLGEYREGARGDIVNSIVNVLLPVGSTPFWDTATLITELSYTHLDKVTKNKELYTGRGYPSDPGGKSLGAPTDDALGAAISFTPEWLQVLPSVNLSMPLFWQGGITGNPAYTAGGFFAEKSYTWTAGISVDYKAEHKFTLQYNDYYWKPISQTVDNGFGTQIYPGGNGAYALNDKGWISFQYKTSF
jgi:hypothetical protein